MSALSRKNKRLIIKIFGLLSIVRWPNVLFTALAQYIAAIFIFTPESGLWADLQDFKLHLIVLSTSFMLAGGYIINSFYDFEKDLINRPHKTLFDRVVSKEFSLYTYFFLNILGLLLSVLASWRVLVYFSCYAFGLWYYSHKLQKFSIVRELSSAVLSVMSVFSIVLYYQYVNTTMVLYGSIFMTVLLQREVIKDIMNYVGDKALGFDSIAVRWGIGFCQRLIALISFLSIGLIGLFYHLADGTWIQYLAITLIGLTVMSVILTVFKKFKFAHQVYKTIMVVLILYLAVY